MNLRSTHPVCGIKKSFARSQILDLGVTQAVEHWWASQAQGHYTTPSLILYLIASGDLTG